MHRLNESLSKPKIDKNVNKKKEKPAGKTEEKTASKEKTTGLLAEFQPTASSPKSFDDVVGMEDTKQQLQEDIDLMMKM